MITDTTQIAVNKTSTPRLPGFDFDNIIFGKHFSDHMFSATYKNGAWSDLQIMPYGPLSLDPAAAALHYGQAIFEGMKAYKGDNGKVLLFRPQDNFNRINLSARRLNMPELPEEIFMEGLKRLLDTDRGWVPDSDGQSLYIRPFMFASGGVLGVKPSAEYKFLIITSPVGGYYAKPVKLKIETEYARAAKGGVGFAKAAGNYAASLYPARLATEQGYDQLLWTDAVEHKYIEEAGTMNIMFMLNDVLVTPSLDQQTILAGITRNSVINVAKDWGVKVEERRISVDEVVEGIKKGALTEAFGCGTAANIAHVELIGHNGEDFVLPPVENRPFANKMKNHLDQLKKGNEKDAHNWIVEV